VCNFNRDDSILNWLSIDYIISKVFSDFNLHHTTGCAVAQYCCKGDQTFQWKSVNFNPRISQTPQFFQSKFAQMITSDRLHLLVCKIWLKSVHREHPHEQVKYNAFVTFYTFPFLPFLSFFLVVAYSKTTEPILMHCCSYETVSRKKCLLVLKKFKFNI